MFLGMVVVTEEHQINPAFIFVTIILSLIFRFVGTYIFSYITNKGRANRISPQEMFIMSYGGLRGAVGFSLALIINEEEELRELFLTTSLAMVLFTCFIQVREDPEVC